MVAKQPYDLFLGHYFSWGGSELLILWNRANHVFTSHEINNTFAWFFSFFRVEYFLGNNLYKLVSGHQALSIYTQNSKLIKLPIGAYTTRCGKTHERLDRLTNRSQNRCAMAHTWLNFQRWKAFQRDSDETVLLLAVNSILAFALIKIIWANDDFGSVMVGFHKLLNSATTTLKIFFFVIRLRRVRRVSVLQGSVAIPRGVVNRLAVLL